MTNNDPRPLRPYDILATLRDNDPRFAAALNSLILNRDAPLNDANPSMIRTIRTLLDECSLDETNALYLP